MHAPDVGHQVVPPPALIPLLDAEKRANDLTADQMPGLPFAPQPAVLVYNTAKIAGPVTTTSQPPL